LKRCITDEIRYFLDLTQGEVQDEPENMITTAFEGFESLPAREILSTVGVNTAYLTMKYSLHLIYLFLFFG
jgi:hypothetical protein